MRKYIQFLLLLLISGLNAFAQLANWTPGINPNNTKFPTNSSGQINGFCRISQLKFHPTNPNKMYAVTAQGGFFSTQDGGNNWTVGGTDNLTGSSASICVDYTNDQVIYMGSGDANYYSNGEGLYKSTDGGATFNLTSLTDCLVDDIIQHPTITTTFIASTNKGMYKSIDNCVTWTATTATNIPFTDCERGAAPNSLILYACTNEYPSRFFRSTDFGSIWTEITSGLNDAGTTVQIAGGRIGVTPADPAVVYFEAIAGFGTIYKSNDGGLTFTLKKAQGVPYITSYDPNDINAYHQGDYNNCIWVDVNDPAKLWLQSHNNWVSTDNGATWTMLTFWVVQLHTDMHQVQQSPFNANELWATNDGGVWLSLDGGSTWTPKSNGLYAYEVGDNTGKSSHTNRDYTIIGTQDNGKLYRDATGWFCIGGGDDYEPKEYDYLPNGGYIYNHYCPTKINKG